MSRPTRFTKSIGLSLSAGKLAELDAILHPLELRQDAIREAIDLLIRSRRGATEKIKTPLSTGMHR